jgi:hypothetical protein
MRHFIKHVKGEVSKAEKLAQIEIWRWRKQLTINRDLKVSKNFTINVFPVTKASYMDREGGDGAWWESRRNMREMENMCEEYTKTHDKGEKELKSKR